MLTLLVHRLTLRVTEPRLLSLSVLWAPHTKLRTTHHPPQYPGGQCVHLNVHLCFLRAKTLRVSTLQRTIICNKGIQTSTPLGPVILLLEAYQAPLSMGFSRQEYWSGVPLPSLIKILEHMYLVEYGYFNANYF